ncbi:GCN5-like N-acetyltransferase [Halodesulfurarchaeum formicicum]|uniref:GCN5-like N-acetyltransferase n=1 Tax=Halodesulfurarchaeum formicicum TaxID=1873524 RepID=A0A1D8S2V9_9EURY|nr:GNAT family N-acetyltransferase [Halodesulfurarchaeum formicicum]AOW79686.1 GCN5-like N-acetyltransferase [Halodesulfurarchaeum formicicum]
MDIRDATTSDIESIRAVAEAAWRADYPDTLSEDTIESGVAHWYGDPVVEMELSNPGTELLVALQDGEVVGFVHGHRAGETGTILRLHVDPAHREAGVETALFDAIEEAFAADGARTLRGTALKANDHVTELYRSRGFEQVDTERTTIDSNQYAEAVYERPA